MFNNILSLETKKSVQYQYQQYQYIIKNCSTQKEVISKLNFWFAYLSCA